MFPHSNVLVFVVVCVSLGTFSPVSQREILSIQPKNYIKPLNPARPTLLTKYRWRKRVPVDILKSLNSLSLENGLNSVKKIMHVNVTLPSDNKPKKVDLTKVVNQWVEVPENDYFAYVVKPKKGKKDDNVKVNRVKKTKNTPPALKAQTNKTKDAEERDNIFHNITGIDLSKVNLTGLAERFMNIDLVNIYSKKIKQKNKKITNDSKNTKTKNKTLNTSSVPRKHKVDISSLTDIEVKKVYKNRTGINEAAKKKITLNDVKSRIEGTKNIKSNKVNTSYTTTNPLKLLQKSFINVYKSGNIQLIPKNATIRTFGKKQNNTQTVKNTKTDKMDKFENRKTSNKKVLLNSNVISNKNQTHKHNEKKIRKTATTLKAARLLKIISTVSPLFLKNERFKITANIVKEVDVLDLDPDDLNNIYDIAKIYVTNDKVTKKNKNQFEDIHEHSLILIPRRFRPDQFIFPRRILQDKVKYPDVIGNNNVLLNKPTRIRAKRHVVDRNRKVTTKTPTTKVELAKPSDLISKRILQGGSMTTESVLDRVTGSLGNETVKDLNLFVIPITKTAEQHQKYSVRQKIWRMSPKKKNNTSNESNTPIIERMFLNNLPKGKKADGLSFKVRLLNVRGKSPRLVGVEINYASQIDLPESVEHSNHTQGKMHKQAPDTTSKDKIYNLKPNLTKAESLESFPTRKFNGSRPSAKLNGTSEFNAKSRFKDIDFMQKLNGLSPLTPHPEHLTINKRNHIVRPIALQMTFQTNVKNLNNILKENIKVFKKGQNCAYSKFKSLCNKNSVKHMKREVKNSKNYYNYDMDHTGTPNQLELGFGNLGLKDEMFEQVIVNDNGKSKKVPPKHNPVKAQNKSKQKQKTLIQPKLDPKKQQGHKQRPKNGTKPKFTYVRKHKIGRPLSHNETKKVLWRNQVRNGGKSKTMNSHMHSKVVPPMINKSLRNRSTILDDIANDNEEFIVSPKDKKEPQKTFKIIRLKHLPLKEVSRTILLNDFDKSDKLNSLEDEFLEDEVTTEINMFFKNSPFDAVNDFRDKLNKIDVHSHNPDYIAIKDDHNPDEYNSIIFPDPMRISLNVEPQKITDKSDLESEFLREDFSRAEFPEYDRNDYPMNALQRNDLLPSGSKIRNHKHRFESQGIKLLKHKQRGQYSRNESPRNRKVNHEMLRGQVPKHKIHKTQNYERLNNEIPRKEWETTELREYLYPKNRLHNNAYPKHRLNNNAFRKSSKAHENNNSFRKISNAYENNKAFRKSSNVHGNVLQSGMLRIPTDDKTSNFSANSNYPVYDIVDEEDIPPDETPMLMSTFLKNPVSNVPVGRDFPMTGYNHVLTENDKNFEDLILRKMYKELYNKKINTDKSLTAFEGSFEGKRRASQLPIPKTVLLKMPRNTSIPTNFVNVIPNLAYKIYGGHMKFHDNELLNNRHLLSLWSTHRHKPREHRNVGGVGPMNIWRHHAIHYAKSMPVQDYVDDSEAPEPEDYDNEIPHRRKRQVKRKFHILCILMQRTGEEESINHIRNTWGKRCDNFVVISSVIAEKQHPWKYTKSGLQFVHDLHHFDNVEWILKANANTYVVMENLRHMVETYNATQSWFFGTPSKSFNTFVISRGALNKLVVDGQGNHACHPKQNNDISVCLLSLSIQFGMARDELNRVLFYPFSPFNWDPAIKYKDEDITSWSDYAVAFENVEEKDLYTLEYFIYHIRPFAMSWSVIKKIDDQIAGPTTTKEPGSTLSWVLTHVNKTKKHSHVSTESVFETDSFYKEKRRQFQQGLFK